MKPNKAHALDAAMSMSFHIGRHWRGASDVRCWAKPIPHAMSIKSNVTVMVACLVLLVAATSAEEAITAPFSFEFSRQALSRDYTGFTLKIKDLPATSEITATFILMRDRKLVGRFPLRNESKNGEPWPHRYWIGCLANDFLKEYESESRIEVYGEQAVYSFLLKTATGPKRGNGKLAEPGGAANGSQPIRSNTNSTSSAAGSRR